jgi:DNA-binding transcriptional ArsR family regulator
VFVPWLQISQQLRNQRALNANYSLTCRNVPIDLIIEGQSMATKSEVASSPKLIPLESLELAAECLKTLAHPHRLRMVQMLLLGRYSVGELAEACDIPSNMASEHLRLMQRCGFLVNEKEGRKAYYRIVEQHLTKIMSCIEERFGESKNEILIRRL